MDSKFTLKIVMLFLAIGLSAKAQVVTVKASAIQSNSASGITNLANAADTGSDYLSTYARITSVSNLTPSNNNKFIEIAFAEDVPVNTPVYLKLASDPENNILGVLAGGAIGNLLTGVLNTVLIGNQAITVEGITATGTSTYTNSSFNTENFKVVFTATGEYFIKITHNAAYRRIKITNNATAGTLDNNKNLDVYGAYFQKGTPTCGSAAYTSYNAGGLLTVVDVNITNPGNAIDGSATTYSGLSLGVLGAGEYIEQTVYFEGSSASTDTYYLKVSIPPSLLAANLIDGITVAAYNGTSTTAVGSGSVNLSTLLGLPINVGVLGLLQNNQTAILAFTPGAAATRITFRYKALVSVNTNYNVFLYDVTKGFSTNVTGAGTFHVGDSVTLTANIVPEQCSATYTYSWVATGTSTVLGTGSSYSPSTTTPGTYNYTVTVTDNHGIIKTASAQVIVQAPPVAGTLNNLELLCTETPSANLTLTGYTGNVVRWEKAADAAFTSPVTIANTTAALTPAQIGTITAPTYFRAVVTQNGYPEVVTTTGGLVAPKTSTWNGTAWSNGTPDISTIIYFTGNYSTAQNLNGCKIIVQNNAVVSIPTGYSVHLNKSIKVVSGSFTLQNNAHLIQDTATEANEGNITVLRNSSNLFRLDYTLWSAPVTGQNFLAFSPATAIERFYYYAYVPASNQELYVKVADPANSSFGSATGYLIRMPDQNATAGYNAGTTAITFEGRFTGLPNNGTITKTLSTAGNRYTAVGNPYPSPINVHDFFNTNSSVLKTGSALYFWRKKNNSNASSYATLTYDLYTYNHAIGGNPGEGNYGGNEWDSYFNTGNAANWVINTGQGFIVKTKDEFAAGSTPQLTFNAAMRRQDDHNNQFFKTAQDEDLKSRIWLNMTGSNNEFSQTAVVYSSTATAGLDYGRDAEALTGGSTIAVWSNLDNTRLVVQARPQFTVTDAVPMGYRADVAGQYTFTIHRADGIFSQGQEIYIKDNILGTTTNVTDGSYTFTTDAGTFLSRFELVYAPQGTLGIDAELTPGSIVVYQQDNAINISSASAEITDVNVFDIRGRKLYAASNINAETTTINNLAIQHEVIIIEINTVKGKVSKKIVY